MIKRVKPARGSAALATIDDRHVISAYARWAPIYDASFGLITRGAQKAAVTEVNRLPAGRILEVGVGTGISLPLYDRKHRVVGVDLSPEMLERARRRVEDDRLDHVEGIHEMDASRLTFQDASFDAAMVMFVITVVPDPAKVMAELVRVVRPGGRVVLVNHFSAESGTRKALETWLSRYSAKLGWHPVFPIERVMGRPELKLVSRRPAMLGDLFTLLVFERA